MLRESPNIIQCVGEPRRRWFFSPEFDLIVWQADGGRVVAFHLVYDKAGDGRVFMWADGGRLRHHRVDGGERAGHIKMTRVPTEALPPHPGDVAPRLERESRDIDRHVATVVLDRLRAAAAAAT